MVKITNLEQINQINLKEDTVLYVYGKTGSGKTYFSKELMKKNNKNALYTTFDDIIKNGSNELYIVKLLGKDFVIIDDEIKKIEQKEITCICIERKLREIQNKGRKIIILGSLTPEELKQRKSVLTDFILSGEQIEICYDIENRIKIAKEHLKKNKTITNNNTIEEIAKEENLGKIKGAINQLSIAYRY